MRRAPLPLNRPRAGEIQLRKRVRDRCKVGKLLHHDPLAPKVLEQLLQDLGIGLRHFPNRIKAREQLRFLLIVHIHDHHRGRFSLGGAQVAINDPDPPV